MRNGLVPDCGLIPSLVTCTRSQESYQNCAIKAKTDGVKTKLKDALFCHGILLFFYSIFCKSAYQTKHNECT